MTAPVASAGLWHNRSFVTYWLGQALSTLGDAFAVVAMPLLMLHATSSVVKMGLMTVASQSGILVASVASGVLVDRFDRRRLMIFCDAARALLWFAVPLTFRLAGPQIWLLYVVAVLSSCLGNTFRVVSFTAIPSLVGREQIARANGALQATFALMNLAGPILSGLLCQRFGPVTALTINAGSFVVSVVSIVFVTLRRTAPMGANAPGAVRLSDLVAGIRFIARDPVLRAMASLFAFGALVVGGYRDVVIYYVKHELHRTDGDVGTLFGLASAGGVLGGLFAAPLRRRLGFGACWLGGWFLFGAALALGGAIGSFGAMCAFGAMLGFAEIVRMVNGASFLQEVTPDHLLGRMNSALWTLPSVLLPAGTALATLLAARIGAARTVGLVGAACMALAFVGLFTPVRTASSARPPVLPG